MNNTVKLRDNGRRPLLCPPFFQGKERVYHHAVEGAQPVLRHERRVAQGVAAGWYGVIAATVSSRGCHGFPCGSTLAFGNAVACQAQAYR